MISVNTISIIKITLPYVLLWNPLGMRSNNNTGGDIEPPIYGFLWESGDLMLWEDGSQILLEK